MTVPTPTVTVTVTTPTSTESDQAPADFGAGTSYLTAATAAAASDPLAPGLGIDAATLSALTAFGSSVTSAANPPADLIPIYQAAAAAYAVPWQILAAINAVETDYGRDLDSSSAGAVGWMQFEPATWERYKVDADHTSRTASPDDPTDAIFAAANLLASNGAATNLRAAVFAYNHADWYVDEVIYLAAAITARTTPATADAQARVAAMQTTAQLLAGTPYLWGGGHGGWVPSAGLDCSGFVSAVLHTAGYLSAPQTTETLPSASGILAGPGQHVTIYDRTGAGADEDHVIIDLDGQWWESGGSGADGGGDDVHRITDLSQSYLASFNTILHPQGL